MKNECNSTLKGKTKIKHVLDEIRTGTLTGIILIRTKYFHHIIFKCNPVYYQIVSKNETNVILEIKVVINIHPDILFCTTDKYKFSMNFLTEK